MAGPLAKEWAFALVPAVALIELLAHAVQTTSGVVSDDDWRAARNATKALARPDDLVVFAPRWTDPVGRMIFGDEIADVEREAPADASRFPRAIEVSIRGAHDAATSSWPVGETRKTGGVTVSVKTNPAYRKTLDDLLTHVGATGTTVALVSSTSDARTECPWSSGPGAQTGGLGFGPAVPNAKYTCGGSYVGISVVTDLDYRPHRCIYAPPTGGNTATRIHFAGVAFGGVIHGHHGLYVEAERAKDGPPVTLTFSSGEHRIGKVTHADGESWKEFELFTGDLEGQHGDLDVDVSSSSGHRRMYCFEAITR